MVREALQMELDGRLGEALDQYRVALATEPSLVQDEATAQVLTIRVVSKAANLSIDLGYGEDAWDLGTRLLSAKNATASAAGTLVHLRLLRLQGRWPEAVKAADDYAKAWPKAPPTGALLSEEQRIFAGAKKGGSAEVLGQKLTGPQAWVLEGDWSLLTNPTEAYGVKVQESVRLQVGAFKDWGHALTLINMLREKGWVPFTEVKITATGVKLHAVYVISRQAKADRARLESQGLTALP